MAIPLLDHLKVLLMKIICPRERIATLAYVKIFYESCNSQRIDALPKALHRFIYLETQFKYPVVVCAV